MPTKFVCVDEDSYNTQVRLKEELLAENERLRNGMQDIVDDFQTKKTDMWAIIKRIQELIE